MAAGESVNCTITGEDDFVVSRLQAPLAGVARLDLVLQASDGHAGADHVAPVPYKALPLRDPGIRLDMRAEGGRVYVDIAASAAALFVSLEAAVPGRFSDNCFTLLPGAKRTILFTPQQGSAADAAMQITARDLYTATR